MPPWATAVLTLLVSFLTGFGLKVIVDYGERESYRRIARRHRTETDQ